MRRVELILRCQVADVPGMLATLAGAVAEAGGDIQAVEVVTSGDGVAIDDLWVTTGDLSGLVAHIQALEGVQLVHAGPSRGLPLDATTRLATGIQALLSGAMDVREGLVTLIGGMLQATSAEIVPAHAFPPERNRKTLALGVSQGVLVLRRDYRFHDAEVARARMLLGVCEQAAAIGASR